MARRQPGDRPVECTDGAIEGQQESIAPDVGAVEFEQRSAPNRDVPLGARMEAASERDASAHARDLAALERDRAADARDLAMAERDAAYERGFGALKVIGAEIVLRAAEQRRRAAQHHAQAAEQRALASQDRQAAARDREQAARDRASARADREALMRQLMTDPLTGARTRAAGLADLERELARCRRTNSPLVVAYVDVVGLKKVNDTEGHGAGDELLKRVVRVIRGQLRSYDLIVRLGGDEFVCAMPNMSMLDTRRRFRAIAATLVATPDPRAIRTGFAELAPDDSATELIARADSQLTDGRHRLTSTRSLVTQPQTAHRDSDEEARGAALSLKLGGGAMAPVRARAALDALMGDVGPEQLGRLELLISELVTNSVLHGGAGPADHITVQITVRRQTVHGEVSDAGPGFTRPDPPRPREIGGLGLVIVDRSTSRWGTSHDGRRVWFELNRGHPRSPLSSTHSRAG